MRNDRVLFCQEDVKRDWDYFYAVRLWNKDCTWGIYTVEDDGSS